MLRVGQRGAFAGGTGDDQSVDALVNLPVDQALELRKVDAVAGQGGDQRGGCAAEDGILLHGSMPSFPRYVQQKIAGLRRLLNCGDRMERPCSAMAISIALRDCDSHAGYSPHAQMNVRLIHLRRLPLSHPAGPAKTIAPEATVDKPRLYSQIAYPIFLIIACFEVPVNSGRES